MIYHVPEIDSETGLFARSQNIYIAGKPKVRIPEIRQMYEDFEGIGHRITYKWADESVEVKKPYRDNLDENLAVAEKMLGAAAMSDVFVFFQDEDLHGALEERGAFAHSAMLRPEGRKMYVVEDRLQRQSIFDSFSFVEVTPNTDKVYADLGKIAQKLALEEVVR